MNTRQTTEVRGEFKTNRRSQFKKNAKRQQRARSGKSDSGRGSKSRYCSSKLWSADKDVEGSRRREIKKKKKKEEEGERSCEKARPNNTQCQCAPQCFSHWENLGIFLTGTKTVQLNTVGKLNTLRTLVSLASKKNWYAHLNHATNSPKWNAAPFNVINHACVFPATTYQNVCGEKQVLLMSVNEIKD